MDSSNTVVVSLKKFSDNCRSVNGRIGKFISETLNLHIINDPISYEFSEKRYENIIMVDTGLAYCTFREQFYDLMKKCRRLIYVNNDIEYLVIDSRIQKYITDIWSIIDNKDTEYINWNMLSYKKMNIPKNHDRLDGLLYYGAYREDRTEYFLKYLYTDLYPVHLSTFKMKIADFKMLSNKNQPKIYEQFKNFSQIANFKTSIYIQNKASHVVESSPANRFFECLSAETGMLFDKNCVSTFEQAGFDVREFVVNSPEDVKKFLDKGENLFLKQKKWIRNFRQELTERLLHLSQE